jgi:hypothetical protein
MSTFTGKHQLFSSIHAPFSSEQALRVPSIVENYPLLCRYGGESFLVGGDVYSYVPSADHVQAMNDATFFEYTKLYHLVAIADQIFYSKAQDVVVATDLTFNNYHRSHELREFVQGSHEIELFDFKGKRWTSKFFNVVKVGVVYQGWASMMDNLLDDKGSPTRLLEEFYRKSGVVIDIGRRTVDIVKIRQLKPFDGDSHDLGTYHAYQKVGQALLPYGLKPSLFELEYRLEYDPVIKIQQVTSSGSAPSINLKKLLSEVLPDVYSQLKDIVVEHLYSEPVDFMYLTGGGAYLYQDYFRKDFPYIQVMENPVYSNVRGMYKFFSRGEAHG